MRLTTIIWIIMAIISYIFLLDVSAYIFKNGLKETIEIIWYGTNK